MSLPPCQGARRPVKGGLFGICHSCPLHDPVLGFRKPPPAVLDAEGVAVCGDRDAALFSQSLRPASACADASKAGE